MMDILLLFPGFIGALIIVFCYECKIRRTEPMNKVHFYVTCDNVLYKKNPVYILWIGKPIKKSSNLYTRTSKSLGIASDDTFYNYGLNIDDFADMEVGEIREVFINMED